MLSPRPRLRVRQTRDSARTHEDPAPLPPSHQRKKAAEDTAEADVVPHARAQKGDKDLHCGGAKRAGDEAERGTMNEPAAQGSGRAVAGQRQGSGSQDGVRATRAWGRTFAGRQLGLVDALQRLREERCCVLPARVVRA